MNRWTRRALAAATTLTLTTLTLGGLVAAGAVTGQHTQYQGPTTATDGAQPTRAISDPGSEPAGEGSNVGSIVVAFVVGSSGTVASDLLAPYDVLASSRAVTAYVVAATPGPAVLDGGPAVLPTYTFDQVDENAALTPDLVVVPAVDDPTGSSERLLRAWVTAQYDAGARILGICAGARVLAATGMLDGRAATSHWSRLPALETAYHQVRWMHGQRWVDDGPVTTTAAITSGVPAALHVLTRLAGAAEARRVAAEFQEFGWSPTQPATIRADGWRVRDWPVVLNLVEPWLRPTIGVRLSDGVSELDAIAPFEVYGQSGAARTVALADSGAVRTRHGLVLLTTARADAPAVSRTVTSSGFGAALGDLAAHTDTTTARSTAKMLGYSQTRLDLADSGRDHGSLTWRPLLLGVGSVALAIAIGRAPVVLARRRRRAGTPDALVADTED